MRARPDVAPISRDERDRRRRPFQIATPPAWVLGPVWGVDGESDAANSCWGSILGLRSLLPQPRVEYMDPDNIPDQSKVACVCSRITSLACPARRGASVKLGSIYAAGNNKVLST